MQTVLQGNLFPLLGLLQESVDTDAIAGFNQLIGNLPVFAVKMQRFTIQLQPRADGRQRGDRITNAAKFNAQSGIGGRSRAPA